MSNKRSFLPSVTPEAATTAREEIAQHTFKLSKTHPPKIFYPNPEYIRILDEGSEGGVSIGMAIAAAMNYLRAEQDENALLSPRMLYEFAKLYDEWPGTDYIGSSIIGGLAGLMQHGVCLDSDWPYSMQQPSIKVLDAALKNRPYTVLRIETSIEHIRGAIFEYHAVIVSAKLHDGWKKVKPDIGVISFIEEKNQNVGATAFVLLGYTSQGFIIQNSWGLSWGGIKIGSRSDRVGGLALWTYEDAATNLTDAWVIQLKHQVNHVPLVGFDADSLDGDDLLDIKDEVNAFSYVLASNTIKPPLALGLFGDWGSGKSFFMQEMNKKITSLAKLSQKQRQGGNTKSPFCSNIIQIRFNAWHYLDSNLWASLVTEIFDKLFEGIGGKTGKPEDQLPKLASELQNANGIYQQAQQQLNDAKQARENAEMALKNAIEVREEKEDDLQTQLDDLKTLLAGNTRVQNELNKLSKELGIPELSTSYSALNTRVNEIKGLGPRFTALMHTMFSTPWGWPRLLTFIAVLLTPVLVVIGIEILDLGLQDFHSFAVQISTLFAAIAAWLGVLAKRGAGWLATLESSQQELEKIRDERRKTMVVEQGSELQTLKDNEDVARHSVQEAELHVQTLQREIKELQPGRLIMRFIKERSKSNDYRSRLGIVSLVRRDFERLSELSDPESTKHDRELMPVERIILYIDDLDRCRPDRVIEVLEAVHLLLAFRLFMVVVAVDPRWLRRCLEKHYPGLLVPETQDVSKVAHVVSSRPATGQDYLEKIFQIPFTLQPLKSDGYRRLIHGLTELNRNEGKVNPVSGMNTEPTNEKISNSEQEVIAGENEKEIADREMKEKIIKKVKENARKERTDDEEKESEVSAIERLQINSWEIADMERLASLFHTPRSVKRFVNTYRFLRANVRPEYLAYFEGNEYSPGSYRAGMTLLAVVISYSNVAPRFLKRIMDATNTRHGSRDQSWIDFLNKARADINPQRPGPELKEDSALQGIEERLQSKTEHSEPPNLDEEETIHPETWEELEWVQLCDKLLALSDEEFPVNHVAELEEWIYSVSRFSFSLASIATIEKQTLENTP